MNARKFFGLVIVVLLVTLAFASVTNAQGPTPRAPRAVLGTGFTYQGQLKQSGSAYSGTCDFQFGAWDDVSVGTQKGVTQTVTSVNVTAGLFTTTLNNGNEFGATAFDGNARWLAIAVRCPAGSGSYATLTPRQAMTAAPYALFAMNATNATTATNFSGALAGDVTGTQSATTVGKLQGRFVSSTAPTTGQILLFDGNAWTPFTPAVGAYWNLTGNSGTNPTSNFVGTTDNTAMEFRAYGTRALRLEPGGLTSPNIIGGYSGNWVTAGVNGAVIGGGGASSGTNRVTDNQSVVAGGSNNQAGNNNGAFNDANWSTVSGGSGNTADNQFATIGGGAGNHASGFYATVPGGSSNIAQGDNSFAAGWQAQALHDGAFVWANSSVFAPFASTADNQFLVRASGGVGINTNNPANTSLQVAKDINGTGTYGQIEAVGASNNSKRMTMGFDTTNNIGWLQASETGVAYRNLALNPNGGYVSLGGLGAAGSTQLCLNGSNQFASCSSSLRYKNNVADLNLGLDAIAQLHPVTFNWKDSEQADLGFVAEQVNRVTPLLTTLNHDGQIEGVKYDRITAILVKGMQEQQDQIANLQSQIATLQSQNAKQQSDLDELKTRLSALESGTVAAQSPDASLASNAWLGALLIAVVWVGRIRRGGAR